jgi:hypothetical protein
MRLTKQDAVATALVAAVVVRYVGYLIRGEMPSSRILEGWQRWASSAWS